MASCSWKMNWQQYPLSVPRTIVEKFIKKISTTRKIAIFFWVPIFWPKKIGHHEKIGKKLGKIGKNRGRSRKNRGRSGKIGKNRHIGEKIGKQILTLLKYKICIF